MSVHNPSFPLLAGNWERDLFGRIEKNFYVSKNLCMYRMFLNRLEISATSVEKYWNVLFSMSIH